MTDPTNKIVLTRTQRAWLALYWAAVAVSLLMLAGGFATTMWWLLPQIDTYPFSFDFQHPLIWVALGLFVGSSLVEAFVRTVAVKRRPVTNRMVTRVRRLAEKRERLALGGKAEALIIVRTLLPHLAGRMVRTQMRLQCNDPGRSPVIVTIPALAAEDGAERRFALVREKAPQWLLAAGPGYRFHARVNLAQLQERAGWGYAMDFEPAAERVRSS